MMRLLLLLMSCSNGPRLVSGGRSSIAMVTAAIGSLASPWHLVVNDLTVHSRQLDSSCVGRLHWHSFFITYTMCTTHIQLTVILQFISLHN
jgi:hypothetical protein